MATGNIDCSLPDRNPDFPNAFNFRYRKDMGPVIPGTAFLDMRSAIAADINDANTHPLEESSLEILDNKCLNDKTTTLMNNNDHTSSSELLTDEAPPSSRTLFEALGINVNDVLQWENRNFHNSQPQLIQSVIPEEQLHINIDCGIESMHSWRPNMTNSLSSDFFLPQPVSESNLGLDLSHQAENELKSNLKLPQLLPLSVGIDHKQVNCKNPARLSPRGSLADNANESMVDIQSYLCSQKAQFNIMKYEVMNAKRKITESREKIDKLSLKLKEWILFQNSQDITKLRSENAELRLECQCLCMEVDFYVKGNAPLGEIDENFYKKVTSHNNIKEIRNEAHPQTGPHTCDAEDSNEIDKWQCSTCTFANHPAINSCEMCHMPRPRKEYPTFPSASVNTCFCHPKKESESNQS